MRRHFTTSECASEAHAVAAEIVLSTRAIITQVALIGVYYVIYLETTQTPTS